MNTQTKTAIMITIPVTGAVVLGLVTLSPIGAAIGFGIGLGLDYLLHKTLLKAETMTEKAARKINDFKSDPQGSLKNMGQGLMKKAGQVLDTAEKEAGAFVDLLDSQPKPPTYWQSFCGIASAAYNSVPSLSDIGSAFGFGGSSHTPQAGK